MGALSTASPDIATSQSPAPSVRSRLFRGAGVLLSILMVVEGGRMLRDVVRFGGDRSHIYAGLLLIGGALLFGALVPRSEDPAPDLEIPAAPPPSPSRIRFDAWTLSSIALVLFLAGFALLRFAMRGEDRLVDAAWLASIVALVAGQWRSRRRSPGGGHTHGRAVHLVLLLLLLGVALTSRLYHLTTLPFNMDGDYADHGLQARAIATGGEHRLFAYGWAAIPMIGFMPSALTMRLAGPGLLGLNLAGVIESLLIIVGVYLLGCELFHPRVGVLAASLLTVSYTFLHFSRTSEYIDPVVFTVWALYLLVRALRHGSGLAAVASGALVALDCEMYYAGRAVVLIAPLVALLVVGRSRRWLVARWRELLLVVLAGAVVLGPMLLLFFRDRDSLGTRTRQVFILEPDAAHHMMSVYGVDTIAAMVLQQARHTALVFHAEADKSTQFGARRPFLDPLGAAAMTLGIGYALVRWRMLGSRLVLLWLVTILVLGCLLTINAPFFPRIVGLVAPAALLGAAALERVDALVREFLSRWSRVLGWLVPGGVLAVALALTAQANWSWYVTSFESWATPRARLARYLAARPELRVYSVAAPFWWARDREFAFLAPGQMIDDLDAATVRAGDFDPSAVLVISPSETSLVSALRARFPDATIEAHRGNSPGEVAFYVFRRSGSESEAGRTPGSEPPVLAGESQAKATHSGGLAEGKPWRASSAFQDFPASGTMSGARGEGIFFHTEEEENPWFEIDLGSPRLIQAVGIVNRRDCCRERAIPLVVSIGTDRSDMKEVGRCMSEFSVWSAQFAPRQARYVRIQVPRKSLLHLELVTVK